MKKIAFFALTLMTQALVAAPTVTNPSSTNAQVANPTKDYTPEKDRFTTSDDQKLGNDIRVQIAELIGAPNSNEIILIIDTGHVKLVGKVPSDAAKAKVNDTIKQMKGVKSVTNKLETSKKA